MKHPLEIINKINKRLISGYYNNPFEYEKDAAIVCYLMGYGSKIDYYFAKARYEHVINKESRGRLMIL